MPESFTMSSASLPVPRGVKYWRGEIDRAERVQKPFYEKWDENTRWYGGESPDAAQAMKDNVDWVNVNVDFYQVEQKGSQLFFDTPELQVVGTGVLKGQAAITQAHRAVMSAILGEDHMDILSGIERVIKDCLCVSGTGPLEVGYEPYQKESVPPEQPGTILGLQAPVKVTLHEKFFGDHFSPKKFLCPADFHDTDWDKAPWLGKRFRLPIEKGRRVLNLPPDFTGTTKKDDYVLDADGKADESSELAYVDGVVIWYRAALYEDVHPELYRELILVDGLEEEARHRDSPHQTIMPTGRLSGDSLMGNPIHPLTIRTKPDSSQVPSDSQMTRPLVRELCKFRTQMVQSRDADRQRILYDSSKLPPEVVAKIADGTLGAMIATEEGALAAGIGSIMAEVVKGQPSRQTYVANDYITRDIEKTLAIDATGAGVSNEETESATKTATVERNRNVRLSKEQRQVLRWYLKLVSKVSALALRYLTPQLAAEYVGPEMAQAWAQMQAIAKQGTDGRLLFRAKPDSQLHLDAATERKWWMDTYQFTAKDPNTVRVRVLKKIFELGGENPDEFVTEQLPEQKPDPNIGFTFKGEDLIGPQAPMVLEILAQGGIQISQDARDESSGQLFQQIALGIRDASGKAVPAVSKPQPHGGTAEKVRPLSQQSADRTGNRPGPTEKTA